jgi:Rad52/22 family double-strand break repair protein
MKHTGTLTLDQINRLVQPVRGDRIVEKQGMSYVPAHEVRAELTRIFGPGRWDSTIHDVTNVYEELREGSDGKQRWVTCYRAACTLRVRDFEGNPVAEFTEYHVEENAPQPNRGEAHALAMTSVASYALRRAAIGLGDALGLHLYDNGRKTGLIRGSLIQGYYGHQEPEATDEQMEALKHSLGAEEVTEEEAVSS